jgi:Tol biopolymer transport system component
MKRLHKFVVLLMCFGLSTRVGGAQQPAKHHAASRKAGSTEAADDPLRSLFFVQQFEQVALSPDGTKVAWEETQIDQDGAETGKRAIYVAEYEKSAKPTRLTAGAGGAQLDEHGLAWAPDSQRLAFLSDAGKPGQLQLYLSSSGAGPVRKLSNVKGLLARPKWAPDGKSIAVLYTENATRDAGPLVAETPETGLIKDAFFEQRLAIVDLAGGSVRQVTPADTYIYEYDWAPDAKSIVLTAAKGNGDSNWYIAELYAVNIS